MALVLGVGVAGMLALVIVGAALVLVRSPGTSTTPDLPVAQAPATEPAPTPKSSQPAAPPAEPQTSTGAAKASTSSPGPSTSQPKPPQPATASGDASDRPKRDDDNGRDRQPSVREVIERIGDAVVYITIVDSFGDELALGSGIVIDASGLVATNYHVIEEAAKAQVQFRDGRKFDVAGYRGLDKSRDLAILELSERPKNATALGIHAPRQPEQGDEVIAFGHPAGFAFTVHTGIVSAIRHTSELPAAYQQFLEAAPDTLWIQTNAAISGGNSGGPLVDAEGNLLGLVTWVAEGQNLGFAVHAKHLLDVYEQMTPTATPLPVPGGPDDLDPRLAEIAGEFLQEVQTFIARLQRARSPTERRRILESENPITEGMNKLLDLAETAPDEELCLGARSLACVLAHDESKGTATAFRRATRAILDHHIDNDDLGHLAMAMIVLEHQDPRDFLGELLKRSPHRNVQGMACLSLALNWANRQMPSAQQEKQVVALLNRALDEFGDVPLGDGTIADVAGPQLFEIEHLAIGKPAANIIGRDLDGVEFELADYRGQVVVLDFWADWCPYCREMYDHERQLIIRYQNEPFALLGINADTLDRMRNVVNLKKVTWRSWWDGPGGPIASQWNVNSFPTIYVLDHNGVIRFKNVRGDDLDRAIEILLEEARSDTRRRSPRTRRPR